MMYCLKSTLTPLYRSGFSTYLQAIFGPVSATRKIRSKLFEIVMSIERVSETGLVIQ